MKSIASTISRKITRKGRGWVFTPIDFQDLGSRDSIDQTLSRLATQGLIRRVTRGIYDYPRLSSFGPIPADLFKVANALAVSTRSRILVSEAYAANILGLTNQVPARLIFLTDGTNRVRQIGNQKIVFKRTSPRKLCGSGKVSGLVLQSLRYFGKDGIKENVVQKLKNTLSSNDKIDLLKDKGLASLWMQPIIDQIINPT